MVGGAAAFSLLLTGGPVAVAASTNGIGTGLAATDTAGTNPASEGTVALRDDELTEPGEGVTPSPNSESASTPEPATATASKLVPAAATSEETGIGGELGPRKPADVDGAESGADDPDMSQRLTATAQPLNGADEGIEGGELPVDDESGEPDVPTSPPKPLPTRQEVVAGYKKLPQQLDGVDAYALPTCAADDRLAGQRRDADSRNWLPGDNVLVHAPVYLNPEAEPQFLPYCTYVASADDPFIGEWVFDGQSRSRPTATTVDGTCPAQEPFITAGREPMFLDITRIHTAAESIYDAGEEVGASTGNLECSYTVTQEDVDYVNTKSAPLRETFAVLDEQSLECQQEVFLDSGYRKEYDELIDIINEPSTSVEDAKAAALETQAAATVVYAANPAFCDSGSGTPGSGTPGSGTPGSGTPGSGTPGSGTPSLPHVDRSEGHGAVVGIDARDAAVEHVNNTAAGQPSDPPLVANASASSADEVDLAPVGGVDAGDGSTASVPVAADHPVALLAGGLVALTATSSAAYWARTRRTWVGTS